MAKKYLNSSSRAPHEGMDVSSGSPQKVRLTNADLLLALIAEREADKKYLTDKEIVGILDGSVRPTHGIFSNVAFDYAGKSKEDVLEDISALLVINNIREFKIPKTNSGYGYVLTDSGRMDLEALDEVIKVHEVETKAILTYKAHSIFG